jgi:SAM-dependent methyltransferase
MRLKEKSVQDYFVSSTIKIHTRFNETVSERAENLLNSCSDIICDTKGSLYLDIGTSASYNASAFGENFREVIALDLKIPGKNILRKSRKTHLVVGDGLNLPLGDSQFDLVSLFSVIEHVPNPERLLHEAFRVLTDGGLLVIQIPNRLFPVEPHSGIPFFFYFPKKLRHFLIKNSHMAWMEYIETPSVKRLLRLITDSDSNAKIALRKMNYSSSVLIPEIQPFYNLVSKMGFFKILPMGYLLLIKKVKHPSSDVY